jgi:hypothetical protein
VEISNEDERLVGFLQRHAVSQGANQMAQVKRPCRPITCQRAGATISRVGRTCRRSLVFSQWAGLIGL